MKKIVGVFLSFLIFGCTAAVYNFTPEDTADFVAKLPKPTENQGTICAFRRNLFISFMTDFPLSISGKEVFIAKNGSYYCGNFPAGYNPVSVDGGKSYKSISTLATLNKDELLVYEISIQSKVLSLENVSKDYGLLQILGIRDANSVFYDTLYENYNPYDMFSGLFGG